MSDPEFIDTPFFPDGMPQPDPDDPIAQGFWDAAKDGRLVVQACNACGQTQHPPELNCHVCYAFDMGWREVAGRGAVWSYVEVVHPAHGALTDFGPYNVALVELDDLPEMKLLGNVIDAGPGEIQIGQAVRVVFERSADDLVQPRWKLAN